jgi:hypothetical protein
MESRLEVMMEALEGLRRELSAFQVQTGREIGALDTKHSIIFARMEETLRRLGDLVEEVALTVSGDDNGRLGMVRRADRSEALIADLVKRLAKAEEDLSKLRDSRQAWTPMAMDRAGHSLRWKALHLLIQNWPGILTGIAGLLAALAAWHKG